jgi:ribose transport system substrate-binding protein
LKDKNILIVAADDTSALGALAAARQMRRENHVAIAGQDAIAEALEEINNGQSAFVATVSHEVHTYGPRLIQLALARVRGQHVAPYHYVAHQVVSRHSGTV